MALLLANCALAIALLGWVAVANERLELVTTSFFHFYAYAIPVFAIAAAAIVLLNKSFRDTIDTRRSDWHLIVFSAVPRSARVACIVLLVAAFAYILLSTGGSASASTWEAAGPKVRSALFAGFSIPALLAWVGLLASARVAAQQNAAADRGHGG